MSSLIGYNDFGSPRSLIEERPPRLPIIGKIRPGIKVLTKAARENRQAVEIHDAWLARGESFDAIGNEIEKRLGIKNALTPRNTPYFTCRRSDFTNPATADEILERYGEDRGDGLKLWRFPAIFAFDDWLSNMPNQLAAWGATGRQFFSEYAADGSRQCRTYAPVEVDARAKRAKRMFGGRTVILRQDESIPDGICDPQQCPQYQSRRCNLSANLFFAIPEIRGLGLIELPTNSIYVLQKAYSAMQTVSLARGGRLSGIQFWISKHEVEISRIDDKTGQPMRQAQMLTMLDAEIDLGALLDGGDVQAPAVELAAQAIAVLEGDGKAAAAVVRTATSDVLSFTVKDTHPVDEADRESMLLDLIARLGLGSEEDRAELRAFAHIVYGKGWKARLHDYDALLAELQMGLENPTAFREKVRATVKEATQQAW